jgi:hypothetical protein
MNADNPFQVPSCNEINPEQRRREWFKKAVIATVAAAALLLVALLIEGCESERAATATPIKPLGCVPTVPAVPDTDYGARVKQWPFAPARCWAQPSSFPVFLPEVCKVTTTLGCG